MQNILITTALWGPADSEYVRNLPGMVESLARQDNQDFAVFFHAAPHLRPVVKAIFNEKAPEIAASGRLHVINLPEAMCTNRAATALRLGHVAALAKPDTVVAMLDADDHVTDNYLSVMAQAATAAPDTFVVADLHSFAEGVAPLPYLSGRLADGQELTFDSMLHGYCTGFSNTAFTAGMIEKANINMLAQAHPDMDRAPDWWVFLGMLGRGCKGVFTSKAHVYYRQHAANLSCITADDPAIVRRNIGIKKNFYGALAQQGFTGENAEKLQSLAVLFEGMDSKFSNDEAAFNAYYKGRSVPALPFWHENAPRCLETAKAKGVKLPLV